MSKASLAGPLLRSVSRSFYLSLRILPAPLRAPVSLAYLLARASDTIADSTDLPGPEREEHLGRFLKMIESGGREGLAQISERVRSQHPGENELIAQLDACLGWLESLPEFDQAQIREVLGKIIHGQTLDVQRFSEPDSVVALNDAHELEEYTYLVAGCVGEFWTRECLHHLPNYSRLDPEQLTELGRDFGKALQLVNILRDLPADLRSGRLYLPGDEVDLRHVLADPPTARECFTHWRLRAEELLAAGRQYIRAIRPARVRAGCFLPWALARKTLGLLAAQYPLETEQRIKVTRGEVRKSLFRSLFVSFTNLALP